LYRFNFRLTLHVSRFSFEPVQGNPHPKLEPIQQEFTMIPASYMFKQVYQQHWETPDPIVQPRRRFADGLLVPLGTILASLFARRERAARHRLGSHVYE
jgi:hypothetical protein